MNLNPFAKKEPEPVPVPIKPRHTCKGCGEVLAFTNDDYNKVFDETIREIRKLGQLKGGEYAGDFDRLANFRRNGDNLGLPMEIIWATYAGKHADAIMQYCKDIVAGVDRARLEPIEGRISDLMLYLVIFKCILQERETHKLPKYNPNNKYRNNRIKNKSNAGTTSSKPTQTTPNGKSLPPRPGYDPTAKPKGKLPS